MTKRDIEIQALLLRHRANGCLSAVGKWRQSENTEMAKIAVPALQARFIQLEAEANGLNNLLENWDELGKHFE